ncbi:MAG: hypothetical protein Q8P87_00465 [bacterium]|nr:hypothetical protein [bacterium]
MNERERKLPFRKLVIVPDGVPELLGRFDRAVQGFPPQINCLSKGHDVSLGDVRRDWYTEEGPVYVGPIPGYPDEKCGAVYIPQSVLDQITSCIKAEIPLNKNFLPSDIKALDF